jgi:hypothetical protein
MWFPQFGSRVALSVLKLNTLILGTLLTADLLPFTSILYRHLPLVCFDLLDSIMRTASQDMVTG